MTNFRKLSGKEFIPSVSSSRRTAVSQFILVGCVLTCFYSCVSITPRNAQNLNIARKKLVMKIPTHIGK